MEIETSTPVLQSNSATRPTPIKAARSPPSARAGIRLRTTSVMPLLTRSRGTRRRTRHGKFAAVANGIRGEAYEKTLRIPTSILEPTKPSGTCKEVSREFMPLMPLGAEFWVWFCDLAFETLRFEPGGSAHFSALSRLWLGIILPCDECLRHRRRGLHRLDLRRGTPQRRSRRYGLRQSVRRPPLGRGCARQVCFGPTGDGRRPLARRTDRPARRHHALRGQRAQARRRRRGVRREEICFQFHLCDVRPARPRAHNGGCAATPDQSLQRVQVDVRKNSPVVPADSWPGICGLSLLQRRGRERKIRRAPSPRDTPRPQRPQGPAPPGDAV